MHASPISVIEPKPRELREPLCDWSQDYRPNAAALIVRRDPQFGLQLLLGERRNLPGSWHWPQGGIDPGETPRAALHREVYEETGLDDVRIRYTFPFRLRYRFPQSLGRKFHPRVGQEQSYFIVSIGHDAQPDLALASSPEFVQLQWRDLATAADHTIWFKQAVYAHAIEHVLANVDQLDL